MGVRGKLASQISIKSEGDVFQLFRSPSSLSDISPEIVQSVDLLDGQWGTVGSVIFWNYTVDGEKKFAKEIIEAVDEKKKSITFKVIAGDVMESFNTFKVIVNVETNGEDNLVTWTFEYEKKSEAVPDPRKLLDYGIALTKEIEGHYLLVPN